MIYLEKGEGQVNIPNFTPSYSNKPAVGRISECKPGESPPPVLTDNILVDSVCPMFTSETDGTKHCHTLHVKISYETQTEKFIHVSFEKTGVTQPLFQSYENLVIGKGSKEFLIRDRHLQDAKLDDVDRIVTFMTEKTSKSWSDRLTSDILLKPDWECDIIESTPTPTPKHLHSEIIVGGKTVYIDPTYSTLDVEFTDFYGTADSHNCDAMCVEGYYPLYKWKDCAEQASRNGQSTCCTSVFTNRLQNRRRCWWWMPGGVETFDGDWQNIHPIFQHQPQHLHHNLVMNL